MDIIILAVLQYGVILESNSLPYIYTRIMRYVSHVYVYRNIPYATLYLYNSYTSYGGGELAQLVRERGNSYPCGKGYESWSVQ